MPWKDLFDAIDPTSSKYEDYTPVGADNPNKNTEPRSGPVPPNAKHDFEFGFRGRTAGRKRPQEENMSAEAGDSTRRSPFTAPSPWEGERLAIAGTASGPPVPLGSGSRSSEQQLPGPADPGATTGSDRQGASLATDWSATVVCAYTDATAAARCRNRTVCGSF